MNESISLEIGGIGINFVFETALRDSIIGKNYRHFLSNKNPQFKLSILCKNKMPHFSGRMIFQVEQRYDISKYKRNFIIKVHTDSRNNADSQILILPEGFKEARLLIPNLKNYRDRIFFDYPLDQLLTTLLLWRKKGLLLHACGITCNDKAFIFIGNSGFGKTTISRIFHSKGLTIFSDDRIIVRKIKGEFAVFGTPWSGAGNFFSPQNAQLGKIFFLSHGKKNRVVKLSRQEAITQMLRCSFMPYWHRPAVERITDLSIDLTDIISCYRLEFLPDGSVYDFLKSSLNA